ncbi:MAG: MinD/ParA family protein [Lachnospiraceae bacterium]|jgi:flagellar biosynthesis protein FlhG|nr:MinD/ParA family protein [Lachnospiraceae bacterium]
MDQAEQLRNIIKAHNHTQKPVARVLTVTSGKGGVGKSNTSINLAIQFRKMGLKVIILDADFGLANIEIMFGAVPKYNLSDLIYEGKNIKEIITKGPMGVGFISGGSGVAGLSNLTQDNIQCIVQSLAELDSLADIVIVDTGAGISDAVMEFLVASGEILLVTTPEPTSITDSYSLLKALSRHPKYAREDTKIKMVANKVQKKGDGSELYKKLNVVVEKYLETPMEYLGEVPEDTQLMRAVMQQRPVSMEDPYAKSALAYKEIVSKLVNKEATETVKRKGMAVFFSNFFNRKR